MTFRDATAAGPDVAHELWMLPSARVFMHRKL
jgi:hypothetical protein